MTIKTVTIQEVATHAGVSTATVSRTLNMPESVKEETKMVVLASVNALGYRRNQAALNLRRRRANAILIIVPDLGNPFFSKILSGIETVFASTDYTILITDSQGPNASKNQLMHYFSNIRADGLISLDGQLNEATMTMIKQSHSTLKIVFGCEWCDDPSFQSVRSDNYKGAELAVEHLHALGHRSIGHITGSLKNVLTVERLHGFRSTMEKNRLPIRQEWIFSEDFSLKTGEMAAQKFMDMEEYPTAVFCGSDQIAFGMMAELTRIGLKLPKDMSIVGFDDIETASYFIPTLTTITQDRISLGKETAKILLKQLEQPDDSIFNEPMVLPVKLTERESTTRFLGTFNSN